MGGISESVKSLETELSELWIAYCKDLNKELKNRIREADGVRETPDEINVSGPTGFEYYPPQYRYLELQLGNMSQYGLIFPLINIAIITSTHQDNFVINSAFNKVILPVFAERGYDIAYANVSNTHAIDDLIKSKNDIKVFKKYWISE